MVLGYVNLFSSKEELQKKNFVIEIEQKYYKTNLQKKALHDPNNIMLKK
jgi:hypothetical protein